MIVYTDFGQCLKPVNCRHACMEIFDWKASSPYILKLPFGGGVWVLLTLSLVQTKTCNLQLTIFTTMASKIHSHFQTRPLESIPVSVKPAPFSEWQTKTAKIYVLFQSKTAHSNNSLPWVGGEYGFYYGSTQYAKHYRDKICMLSLQKGYFYTLQYVWVSFMHYGRGLKLR